MDNMIQTIFNGILEGDQNLVLQQVEEALHNGLAPDRILKDGLVAAMGEVGRLFEAGEYYVPEMLVAARAMQSGLKVLKPHLVESGVKAAGKVVIGTVSGDLHDIGKNLVGMMLEGAGFEVIDVGTDVPPQKFVDAVKQHQPDILGMSALLTTTTKSMPETIKALTEAGLRDKVKILIGGAPITDEFAKKIGADGFAADAGSAAREAKALIGA